ncbi:Endonuclease/exonuclease/phosphatase [Trinorchestia longiramus]|nr:Endonuclease/exonuclease/phosphatase [Trinorchestia longiramus]
MEDEQDGEWKIARNSRKRKEKPVEESEIQEGGKKKMHTSADGAEGSEKEKPYDNLCPSRVNRNPSFDRADASTSAQSNSLREKREKGRVSKPNLGFNITKTMRLEDSKVILMQSGGVIKGIHLSVNVEDIKTSADCGSSELLSVTRLPRYSGGIKEESSAVKLGFAGTQCPSHIYVGFTRYAVFPFNAPPRRCYCCQRLGHVAVNCNSPLRCLVCSGPHTKDEYTAEPGQEKCANCHQTHTAGSKEYPAIRNAAALQKLQRSGVGFEAAKHKVMKTQTELATKAPFMKKQNLTVPKVSSNIMGSQHSIQENQQENQNDLTIQEVMVDFHQSGGSYLCSDAEALPSTASSSPLYSSLVQGLVDLPSTSEHFQLSGVQERTPSNNITQPAKKPSPQMTTGTECAEILSKSVASLGKKLEHQMKEMGSSVIQRLSLELKNKMESVITEVSHTILSKVSSLLSELILANMQKEQPPQRQLLLADTAPKPNFVGYVATWCPRVGGVRGGGLAILVRLDIPFHHLRLEPFDGNLELQGVTLNTASGLMDIINVYNPNQPFSLSELKHYLQQLNYTFLFLGDFNAHSPLWDERSRTNSAGRALEETLDTFPVGIINNDSTTYIDRRVGTTSTLDLFFATHNFVRTREVRTGADLGSDDLSVCCTLGVVSVRHWKLGAADWTKWTSHLNAHTNQTHVGPCNAIMGNDFLLGAINSAAEKSVPMSTGRTGISRATPWWDAACSKAVAQRRRAKGQLLRCPSQENLIRYKRLEAVAKRTILLKKRNSFAQYVGALTCSTPSGAVWRCIQNISGRASMPNYPVGGPHATALEKAKIFSEHFRRHSPTTATTGSDESFRVNNANYFETEESREVPCLTMEELNSSLSALKNKAPGQDGVYDKFLQKLPLHWKKELLCVYNTSLYIGCVRPGWKWGIWLPILKPEKDPDQVSSYRPICLLSCIGKLMERMIQRRLEYWVETNNLLLGEQAGFRGGKSTVDSLLIAKDLIAHTFSRKQICVAVYLDLDGAYNSVWHEGIIYKLIASGLEKTYVKWLKNYLTGRTASVCLGAVQSEGVPITWGLSQGAVLSPLLFNIMLSDLPVADGVQLIIFADDITILSKGDSLTEVRACLERYLDSLAVWFKKWKHSEPSKMFTTNLHQETQHT